MIAKLKDIVVKTTHNPRYLWNNNKITKLRRVLSKSKKKPGYFFYYLQNVHFVSEHFPHVYNYLKGCTPLKLGGEMDLKRLHVILRTTDSVMNINSSRQLEEIGIVTKNDVIRVGGCSLFKAGARFAELFGKENLRITLVTDRLSDAGLAMYEKAANDDGLTFDIVEAKDHGNGPTFQTQIDIALQDEDDTLVLIFEDDYLLDEDSFTTCFRIMKKHSNVIGMTPHFHPDRVRKQDYGKLVSIDGKLYCRVNKTCCTFFMPIRYMRRYEKYLRIYDGWEDGSVNSVWKKGICLSPLGWTLAEHLHRCDLSPVNNLLFKHEE